MIKIGDMIDSLQLTKLININNEQRIFLTKDITNNKYYAIKVVENPAKTEKIRLKHEAEILSQINHPNIIKLINFTNSKNLTYLTLEYLDGVTLNNITPKNKGLPLLTIWPFLKSLANALIAIHQQNIVHLDLKPSNILLIHQTNKINDIKLIDFDTAIDLNKNPQNIGLTRATAGYIAPELILNTLMPSPQADIYSFGALMVFLLTGKKPFSGDSAEKILAKQLKFFPDALAKIHPHISSSLYEFLIKSLAQDPANRFINIESVLKELFICYQKEQSTSRP